MQLKNIIKSIVNKMKILLVITLKKVLITILFSCMLLVMSNCKKLELLSGSQTALEKLFEENVLNKEFVVNFASDSTADITNRFSSYTFSFSKTNSFYEGTVTATKTGATYTGTWASNSDFSKLTINITTPAIPAELVFLNRAWKFTQKNPELMKLAPWYDDGPKVLYIKRL